jgi:hypothetical protein
MAQKYAITGPGWSGTLPAGVTEYKAPSCAVWIIGRIYCSGTPKDYEAVHQMQDELSLVPLSSYGKPYTPPEGTVDPNIDMKTPPRAQVDALDIAAYFNLMARLMKDNPPVAADAPMVARMAKIGIVPGQPFDLTKLSSAAQQALKAVPKAAVSKIMGYFKDAGKAENGWVFFTKTGIYGTDYLDRAFVTAVGLGANRQQDAVYPTTEIDAAGKPYSGANKYVIVSDQNPFAGGIRPLSKCICTIILRTREPAASWSTTRTFPTWISSSGRALRPVPACRRRRSQSACRRRGYRSAFKLSVRGWRTGHR